MSQANLRAITNHFQDMHLISLRQWKMAGEFPGRDAGEPYLIGQSGYDPQDLKMNENEFLLGRSGQWLAVGHFYQLPVDQRRKEYLFETAAEVMQLMQSLPTEISILRTGEATRTPVANDEASEFDAAITAARAASAKG